MVTNVGKRKFLKLTMNFSNNIKFLFFLTAIYLQKSKVVEENGQRIIKHEDNPGSIGVTYELCAGIVDKDTSLEQIAQAEVLEECGYKVPLDKLERFCSCRSVHIFLLR